MSNTDFQARLQRISGNSNQSPAMPGPSHTGRPRTPKLGYGRVGAGGAAMMLGVQVLKYAYQSYGTIRDTGGIAMAVAIGIAGFALTLFGIAWIVRAAFQRTAAGNDAAPPAERRRPSTAARVIFSLLGFAFGAIASFYMFLAAAARLVDTDAAHRISNGGVLIAMCLALLSLLFGFAGLFLRGRGLGRVPVYFCFGGALTYAAFRLLRINLLEWPQFMAALQ